MDNSIAVIHGHDHHLIWGENDFKLSNLGQSTGAFEDARQSMQFASFFVLEEGPSSFDGLELKRLLVSLMLFLVR